MDFAQSMRWDSVALGQSLVRIRMRSRDLMPCPRQEHWGKRACFNSAGKILGLQIVDFRIALHLPNRCRFPFCESSISDLQFDALDKKRRDKRVFFDSAGKILGLQIVDFRITLHLPNRCRFPFCESSISDLQSNALAPTKSVGINGHFLILSLLPRRCLNLRTKVVMP